MKEHFPFLYHGHPSAWQNKSLLCFGNQCDDFFLKAVFTDNFLKIQNFLPLYLTDYWGSASYAGSQITLLVQLKILEVN